jgi:hypothetical protein
MVDEHLTYSDWNELGVGLIALSREIAAVSPTASANPNHVVAGSPSPQAVLQLRRWLANSPSRTGSASTLCDDTTAAFL